MKSMEHIKSSAYCVPCNNIFVCANIPSFSFLDMIKAEQDEDEAVLRDRLSSWSLERLKQEGYCITGMSAYWTERNRIGRPVAVFALGPGITLPEHQFEYVLCC